MKAAIRRFWASLASALLLAVLGMVVSFCAFGQIERAALARKHTYTVLNLANQWLSTLKDAETGQRGYLVTGDETFLEPYLAVRDGIGGHLLELRQVTSIVAARKHLDNLAPLTEATLAELSQTIELRRQGDMAAMLARVGSGHGKDLMDSIRSEMEAFIQIEETAQAQDEARFQARMRSLFVLLLVASLLMLVVAVVFVYLMHRHSMDRLMALVHLKTQDLLTMQEETSRQLQKTNDALELSEEKLSVTLNSIGDAVLATDAGGRVTYLNSVAEELTGWTLAQAAGRLVDEVFQIINKDTRLAATIPVKESLEHGTKVGLANHTVLIARDGSECDVADSCAPIRDRAGKVIGAVLVFRDVTGEYAAQKLLQDNNAELVLARTAAEKANQAKSDFLSSMSHELRSPLNAILGFAQLMESDAPPPSPAQKASIDQILHAGWYLLELINDILDLAVVESGRLSLSLEAVSLPEVMIECQAMIEPQAQKRGITMTFPKFDAPCFIRADRTRLKQVLINLLSNAIKYNKEGGTVVVDCGLTASSRLRISIRDTGAGLSPEMLAQLFQPFNRLGKEATGEEGTGIGLVVSKRLVELMRGTISVQSTVGAGSVFTIKMNADLEPPAEDVKAAGTTAATPAVPAVTPSRLLLHVEDNPANLKLIEQLIARRPDLRLLTAINGEEAIDLARSSLPDVILMDINLPGISGIEAMKIIHGDPATAHIPVVALSANAIPRDIEKGLEAGFFRYLTKPIKVAEFLETLDQALEAAGAEGGRKGEE